MGSVLHTIVVTLGSGGDRTARIEANHLEPAHARRLMEEALTHLSTPEVEGSASDPQG